MNDDKYLDKKVKYIKLYIILGIILILINFYFISFNINIGDFKSIMLNTLGAIFVVMGISKALLYKNKVILNFYKIQETDERNELLRGKAGYLTFVFSSMGLAICSIIFSAMDLMIPFIVILTLLFVQFILFFSLVWYYSKKL